MPYVPKSNRVMLLMKRFFVVVEFTRSHVKIKTKLINFMKFTRIKK